jgi:hypothetical protein
MSESALSTQPAKFEDVLSRLGLKAQAKRLAMDALVRLVDERIRRTIADLQAGQLPRAPATYPEEALGGGIERAESEGQRFKRETLSRAEMLAPEKAAALAGISRQALDLRRKNAQALALSHAKRGFRYPAWQFDEELAEPLMRVLPKLAHLDAWGQYLFLTRAEPLLEGRTPLEALRAGELSRVERVIRLLSEAETA